MKLLIFTKYSRKGASSRLRSYQYADFFENESIQVSYSELFNDIYLESIYKQKLPLFTILSSYLKRIIRLITISRYDIIIIEKELFPYFPPIFEFLLRLSNKKFIVDFDDAIFHNYDLNKNPLIRRLLKSKIETVMRLASAVTVGNSYLKEKAINSGAEFVHIIPTSINMARYAVEKKPKQEKLSIVWIGSPTTFEYLKLIEDVLKRLVDDFGVEIKIIGINQSLKITKNVEYLSWDENKEVRQLSNCDIGIMPLKETPWAKGKCAYKLIQYMGVGLPVVASPVGMNNEIVKHNYNGFLANDSEEWYKFLSMYIRDRELRNTHGMNGLSIIRSEFNTDLSFRKICNVINDIK